MTAKPPSRALARGGVTGRSGPPVPTPAGAGERRIYEGAVTTLGRSKAVRLEERFFVDHPEFAPGAPFTVRAIAPGCVLMAVEKARAVGQTSDGLDPLVGRRCATMRTFRTISRLDHRERGAKPSRGTADDPGSRPCNRVRHGSAPSRLRRMRPIFSAYYAENVVALRVRACRINSAIYAENGYRIYPRTQGLAAVPMA